MTSPTSEVPIRGDREWRGISRSRCELSDQANFLSKYLLRFAASFSQDMGRCSVVCRSLWCVIMEGAICRTYGECRRRLCKNGCVNIRTFCPMKKASSRHHDQYPCYLEAPPILPYRRTLHDSCGGCSASHGLSPQTGPGPDQAFDKPRQQAFSQASHCASAPVNKFLSLHLHRHRLIFSTGSIRGMKRDGCLDTIRSSSLSNIRSLLRRM